MTSALLSYGGLFFWSFLAATVLPLSSEVPLVVLVREQQQFVAPVLVATVGNVLGSCTTYWLARRAARILVRPPVARIEGARAAALLRRWGQPALLLSWVPVLGDGLVGVAGALAIPFGAFVPWVLLGKGLRYLVVAWVALAL